MGDSILNKSTNQSIPELKDEDCCKLVSDETQRIIEYIFYISASGLLGLSGIVSNCFNIAVFFKQGLQDSSNVSLFCLSCSDFFISLYTFLASVCFAIARMFPYIPVDMSGFYLVTVGNPLQYFYKLSMVATMFLCFERCVCVIRPLTVKLILTRGRSILILSLFYLELTICYAIYLSFDLRLSWQFNPIYNMTRLQIHTHPMRPTVLRWNHMINGTILTTFCLAVVIMSTTAMVIGVYRATKKRQKMLTKSSDKILDTDAPKISKSILSKKDIRLVQMVIYIAILFLVSNFPAVGINFVEAFIEPGLDMYGKYHNLNQVLWSLVRFLGALSAGGNILIYYLMSERYRTVFQSLIKSKPQV